MQWDYSFSISMRNLLTLKVFQCFLETFTVIKFQYSTRHFLCNQISAFKQDNTVKPVLSGHSKIDKTNVLMTNSSLMKDKSIAECSDSFDLH